MCCLMRVTSDAFIARRVILGLGVITKARGPVTSDLNRYDSYVIIVLTP